MSIEAQFSTQNGHQPTYTTRHPVYTSWEQTFVEAPTEEQVSQATPPLPITHVASIDRAFAGYAQAQLLEVNQFAHHERATTAAQAFVDLDKAGLTREEIKSLQFGFYTTPSDIHGFLRGVGFTEQQIIDSGLVYDAEGHLNHSLAGSVLLPVRNTEAELIDYLVFSPVDGHISQSHPQLLRGVASKTYGLDGIVATEDLGDNVLMVESVLDAIYLQCRGFANTLAIAGDGSFFSPRRWEELATRGIDQVTLLTGATSLSTRKALEHALKARRAPQVLVIDDHLMQSHLSPARYVQQYGVDAFRNLLGKRSHAFHSKDFGWTPWVQQTVSAAQTVQETVSEPQSKPQYSIPTFGFKNWEWKNGFHYTAAVNHLRHLASQLPNPIERDWADELVNRIDTALQAREFGTAKALSSQFRQWHAAQWGTPFWAGPVSAPKPYTTQSTTDVLEHLFDETRPSDVTSELKNYSGDDLKNGDVITIYSTSAQGQLAQLADCLLDRLQHDADGECLVVTGSFTAEQFLLGTITNLVRRLTGDKDVTMEQVQLRLCGAQPEGGFEFKPWLVDEAVDQVKGWASRVTFIRGDSSYYWWSPLWENQLKAEYSLILFDTLPYAGHPQASANWYGGLKQIAEKCDCPVVVCQPAGQHWHGFADWPGQQASANEWFTRHWNTTQWENKNWQAPFAWMHPFAAPGYVTSAAWRDFTGQVCQWIEKTEEYSRS